MITTLKPLLSRVRAGGKPSLPPGFLKSLAPLMALAVGVTALVLMFLWRDQSAYKPVFGAREKVAAADMMSVLDAERVPYRLHPDTGQVLVPDAMLGKVRMLLAAKGVTARLPAGLELMDRNEPLGVSQFVQDVHFRRGLEGELVQSILTLDAVDSARVHLSIAKSSSFVINDGEKSSASVVLTLKPGRTLNHEQIAAIINMVAGSVANLDPQRVSLVDQAGNLLSSRVDLSDGFDAIQGSNDAARRYQDETRRNIRDLLANVIGEQGYRVSVTADVDNDRIQETHEEYGSTPKVTTEAVREEKDREALAVGVPGSLSNRPVNVTPPQAQASQEASTAQKSATSRQYFYDRNITQIKRSRGRLKRLNVAVVLDAAAAPGRSGAWSNEQIENIERILRSGLGINTARGDQLTVSTLPFPAKPAAQPWWQERDNIIEAGSWAAYAIGALLAYLLLFRPLLRIAQQRLAPTPALPAPEARLAELMPATALPAASETGSPVAIGNAAAAAPPVPLLENYELPPPGSPVDVMVEHLKVLASKEPERVAEVVKQWVQKNVRPE